MVVSRCVGQADSSRYVRWGARLVLQKLQCKYLFISIRRMGLTHSWKFGV